MPQNSTSSSFLGRLTTSTRSSFLSAKDVRCNVHLLHDSDIIGNEFPRTQSAQTILDYVCEMKHIQEKDFLGLRYQDHNKHRYWLDLSRSIGHVVKQFRTETMTLHLRFRYYPSDPTHLRDPNLRYQLFVQLQRDLLHGRLYCPTSSAAELAALILQTQLGDYDEEKHIGNYVSEFKLLLKQTPKLEERIAQNHKQMRGKSSDAAELEFLEKASQLDTYAFDPYTIKDPQDSGPVYLGASCKGILVYAGQARTHNIDWSELVKVDYSGKEIRLTLSESYRGQITAAGTPTGTLNGHGPGSPISGSSGMDKYQVKKPMTLKYTCPSSQFFFFFFSYRLFSFNQSSNFTAEMIHTASLVHDDVIDEANTRRGSASVNAVWGNKMSVLVGDFILARATQILCSIGKPNVIAVMASIIEDLVLGEFMQMSVTPSEATPSQRMVAYIEKTHRKTASLFASSCRSTAILAVPSNSNLHQTAYEYGRNLGIAFQLADDLLDFIATSDEMGKPVAADLKLGLATAPVLYACEQYPELTTMLLRKFKHEGDAERARDIVMNSDGMDKTRQLIDAYSQKAVEMASSLPNRNESTEQLIKLALSQTDRKF